MKSRICKRNNGLYQKEKKKHTIKQYTVYTRKNSAQIQLKKEEKEKVISVSILKGECHIKCKTKQNEMNKKKETSRREKNRKIKMK